MKNQGQSSFRVFVGGLLFSTTEETVSLVASRFGKVSHVKIVRNKSKRSGIYAFVTFAHAHAAKWMFLARIVCIDGVKCTV